MAFSMVSFRGELLPPPARSSVFIVGAEAGPQHAQFALRLLIVLAGIRDAPSLHHV